MNDHGQEDEHEDVGRRERITELECPNIEEKSQVNDNKLSEHKELRTAGPGQRSREVSSEHRRNTVCGVLADVIEGAAEVLNEIVPIFEAEGDANAAGVCAGLELLIG